jgi:replicative DNA helicase
VAQRASLESITRSRIPPHNMDAEQSVLGAMMESKEAISNVGEILKARDFYKPAHGHIFEVILELDARGEPADAITVADELGRRGLIDGIGGKTYLGGLLDAYPTASSAARYAKIVFEHALLRRLIEAGVGVQEIGFSMPEDVSDAVDQAEQLVYEVGDRQLRNEVQPLRALLGKNLEDIEKLYDTGSSVTGLASGFADLDDLTLGFQPSQLIIVAARPAMGKSALLNDFALSSATKQGKPVVIFSLEMGRHELVQRFLASEARVDSQKLRKGTLQDADWQRLSAAIGRLAEAPIYIDDSPNVSLMEMRAKCRRLKSRGDLGLVIIDYLQLMQSPRKSENRQQEVSEISRGLKILARELEVPVLCASQLNRGVEFRSDKRPMLGDLRESGCLTGDTQITRADTGTTMTMLELYESGERNIPVWTLDENLHIVKGTMSHVFSSGVKKVYELKLRSGRSIKASANHPFFRIDGWHSVGELAPGDHLAIPRTIGRPTTGIEWPDEHIILLAHLIGDGSFVKNQPIRYASASEENVRIVAESAKAFGVTAKWKFDEAARSYQVRLPAPYHLTHGRHNPIAQWLDGLGLFGKRSGEKFVPAEVFALSDEQVGLFLRHLWATDGCIQLRDLAGRKHPAIYYASSSRRLAEDVAGLLLRFGIVVRFARTLKRGYADMHSLVVRSGTYTTSFLENVGAAGSKVPGFEQVRKYASRVPMQSRMDALPADMWQEVVVSERGRSMAAIERGAQVKFRRDFGRWAPAKRETMLALGRYLENDYLVRHSESDIYWDEIVQVEYVGEQEVFDATVPVTHNFLANGIISHNSIEQDSDVVMFIYRDEVYNPDSDAKGEAELIIAKHRNGPTGKVQLAFMNQYTKFASIARGPVY